MKKNILVLLVLVSVAACNNIPREAYQSRGEPGVLLTERSERTEIILESDSSISELGKWLDQYQPSRAEVLCQEGDELCKEAQILLGQFDVPVDYSSTDNNLVVLVYDSVVARDCDHAYMTNHINPYNLNHPTFGCSYVGNMVQMISDKTQITSPMMLGMQDAETVLKMEGSGQGENNNSNY